MNSYIFNSRIYSLHRYISMNILFLYIHICIYVYIYICMYIHAHMLYNHINAYIIQIYIYTYICRFYIILQRSYQRMLFFFFYIFLWSLKTMSGDDQLSKSTFSPHPRNTRIANKHTAVPFHLYVFHCEISIQVN